ncbi:MAG TPA: hypothetical protein EYP64_01690 [Desulfarculaceae bacterium]|nr:hypothetical protein [Desulfarculaceae bacterium]
MNPEKPVSRVIRANHRFRNISIWLLLILLITSGGCSFKRLKKDLAEHDKLVRIRGEVNCPGYDPGSHYGSSADQ